jgi:hypothetical protein
MMRVVHAHGADPGPPQRPFIAGALTAALAAVPAGAVFAGFGSFRVVTEQVLHWPAWATAGFLLAAFVAAGLVYGGFFHRAANDRRTAWMLGLAFGFLLWIAAPIVVLPLLGAHVMAAGRPALGFLASFLVWGLTTGLLFPYVHRPFQAGLSSDGGQARFGPDVAGLRRQLLRR